MNGIDRRFVLASGTPRRTFSPRRPVLRRSRPFSGGPARAHTRDSVPRRARILHGRSRPSSRTLRSSRRTCPPDPDDSRQSTWHRSEMTLRDSYRTSRRATIDRFRNGSGAAPLDPPLSLPDKRNMSCQGLYNPSSGEANPRAHCARSGREKSPRSREASSACGRRGISALVGRITLMRIASLAPPREPPMVTRSE